MPKSKYQEWLEPNGQMLLAAWARDGLSDGQIAEKMGIATSTLYLWKKDYVLISEALRVNKELADIPVENAVYKKALGFKETLVKPFKLRHVDYNEEGKKIREYETLEEAVEEIYIPPSEVAQMFWLKNRMPDKWREKQEVTGTITVGVTIVDDIKDE